MNTYGIREIQRTTGEIIDQVIAGETALITRHGKPVAVLLPVDSDMLEEFILSNAPEFVRSFENAESDLIAGSTTALEDLED